MKTITDICGTSELYNGVRMPYLGLGVWQSEDGPEVEQAVAWALKAGVLARTRTILTSEISL